MSKRASMTWEKQMRSKMSLLVIVLAVIVPSAAPAWAQLRGFVEDEFQYGFFYTNFDVGVSVFAGGPVESFCEGEPGSAPLRVFERKDGSVDLKVDAKNEPIWVYQSDIDPPVLVEQVCTGQITPPQAFAIGTANLKVRISILTDGTEEIFNGVNGKATAADGSWWRISTWADFSVIDGELQGDPAEFQGVSIRQIGRR
jgi:hypothetical protein